MENNMEMKEDLIKDKNPVLETLKVLLEECRKTKDPQLVEATTKFMEVSYDRSFI